MASTKDPGKITPLARPADRSTAAFGPFRAKSRGTESLMGRLQATRSGINLPSTSHGRDSGGNPVRAAAKAVAKAYDPDVMRRVREAFHAKFGNLGSIDDEDIEHERSYFIEKIAEAIQEVITERRLNLPAETLIKIREDILESILGFGPLQKLLDDEDVTEIMVNGPSKVYIERRGKLYLSDVKFDSDEQLLQVIEKIVIPLGRRVDESQPMTDARLPDGSRVNIVIPPLALSGPTISIRKFQKDPLRLPDLVSQGTLTSAMAVFLEGCVRSKLNMIVSGETGSGKTTTLNALSGFLPRDSRIITIEDSAELQLQQDHVIPLESRQANIEGRGEVSIRDLVINSLHMIPDRIVVGECRGGEALDMLNAMNSGNDGSMTTGHANTPRDMISRLETMVMMAGMNLTSLAIREQIANALQIIVHQNRLRDGTRRVTSICETDGIKDGKVVLREIFKWDPQYREPDTGELLPRHVATGLLPECLKLFIRDEFFVPDGTFGPDVDIEEVRDYLHQLDLKARAEEQELREARQVMQQALQSEEDGGTTKGTDGHVFHWRTAHYRAGDVEEEEQDSAASAAHLHRLQRLQETMARRRKSLMSSSDKEAEDEKLIDELRVLIIEKLPSAGSFEELEKDYESIEEERRMMDARIVRALDEVMAEEALELSKELQKTVVHVVSNDIVGLGPLQVYIEDRDVSEIMVNGPDRVFVERNGRLQLTETKFKGESHLRHIISQILRPINRRIDETTPMVDARLRDGSRVNIVIPPIALAGTILTIRKFAAEPFKEQDLIGFGTMTARVAAFLHGCVKVQLNMIISGSTGSGKTTTLNTISSYIQDEARIITIEDAAELQLQQQHVIPLEARPSNIEGTGAISIRQLVMNALHMRPDRIVVGECRGGEALDMLMAMNTGQEGSLTTLHSNSPYDTVLRLQTLVMLSGMNLPLRAINEQIASAVHVIVHQDRLPDGSRHITHVTELLDIDDNKPVLNDIYRWVHKGIGENDEQLGELAPTGNIPTYITRFVEDNIQLPADAFGPKVDLEELYARIKADQEERSREDRARLHKLSLEEDARQAAEVAAIQAAVTADGQQTTAATSAQSPPMAMGRKLQSKVFTWKDAMKAEDLAQADRASTVSNERRWQLFRKLRKGSDSLSARQEEAETFEGQRQVLSDAVAEALDTVAIPSDFTGVDTERTFMSSLINEVLDELRAQELIHLEKANQEPLLYRVLSDFCGYGPIQSLMDDVEVSEVMVNGPKKIYVERKGRVSLSDQVFVDDGHVQKILQRMLTPVNRRCDLTSPMVDARLLDGSRINAVIPPLALTGTTLTIRRFAKDAYTIDKLVEQGSLSQDMCDFLRAAIAVRLNVVVSGGTGSGKTTTLNAISAYIPVDDRIVSIEDTAELQLQQDHVVPLESRPPNLEGKGQITIRELVKNALHMRPERIIVGECRGGEALDMLQAMATGQSGSLTTGHANSPKEMIARLEVMVLMSGTGLPVESIREQMAGTIDIIVQQQRFRDGTRRVTHISEVTGLAPNGEVEIKDIFRFETLGFSTEGEVVGEYKATGYIPSCINLFRNMNTVLRDAMFGDKTSVEREYERIDRQRKIRQKTEKRLEKLRSREDTGSRPLITLKMDPGSETLANEVARRKGQQADVSELLSQKADNADPATPERPLTPEVELAVQMRERMAEKEKEQTRDLTGTSRDHLDYLENAGEASQAPANAPDITSRLRSRRGADSVLLRRLKESGKKEGDERS